MSDSILVRITLDSYDVAHPSRKQTQVYVQIPEVARASWLLDASLYEELTDEPWPSVLDLAHEAFVQRGTVSDPTSGAARKAVRDWLSVDENRDAVAEAWFADVARRNPVARALLADTQRLGARIAELEKANEGLDDLRVRALDQNEELRDQIAELEDQRDRRRVRLVALQSDALDMRGSLSPNGEDRKVPFEIGETLTPAVDWLIARVAELEAAQGTVYRASHDSIVMGHYATRQAAYEHCEAHELRDDPVSPMAWNVDEDGVAELVRFRIPRSPGAESPTGFVVTPLEIASEYDAEADE